MFNMNNSMLSKRLVSMAEAAVEDVNFGGTGQYYMGLAVGIALCHDECKWHIDAYKHLLVLYKNAIAHAKAKKEQK